MKTVINYPAWHEDARAMRVSGKTVAQIADHYGFTATRMSQIATPNWKAYLIAVKRQLPGKPGRHATVKDSMGLEDQYEFIPVPTEGPPTPKTAFTKPKNWIKPGEEFMPSIRDFKPLKKYEDGKVLAGAQIECSVCRKEASYFKTSSSVNPVFLPKEFAHMGWTVGKTARGDLCPDCTAAEHAKHPVTEENKTSVLILEPKKPIETKKVIKSFDALSDSTGLQRGQEINARYIEKTIVKEDAPASISRDPIQKEIVLPASPEPTSTHGLQSLVPAPMDKTTHRIIFAKLNDVYLDEKTGYQGDWNDAKVATDLGIDAAHVAEVRSSFFGPETNASLMRAAIDNIVKAGEAIERRVILIDKKIEQMQALDDKVVASQKEIEASIERFEQLMANLTTQDNNMQTLIDGFTTEVSSFKKMYAELKQ
jgi:hypothetical protein